MSWSYSGNPATTSKDKVRFLVGDTITADQLVQDEEITAMLVDQPNTKLCGAIIAEAIAARFSRLADTSVGKTSVSYSQRAEAYLALAAKLRKQSKSEALYRAMPYAGGISVADKEIDEENEDRVKPKFQKDLFENPSTDPARPDGDDC